MEHKDNIKGYDSIKKLADDIGDLRYDVLYDLFCALSMKLEKDSINDYMKGRYELSTKLKNLSNAIGRDSIKILDIWRNSWKI